MKKPPKTLLSLEKRINRRMIAGMRAFPTLSIHIKIERSDKPILQQDPASHITLADISDGLARTPVLSAHQRMAIEELKADLLSDILPFAEKAFSIDFFRFICSSPWVAPRRGASLLTFSLTPNLTPDAKGRPEIHNTTKLGDHLHSRGITRVGRLYDTLSAWHAWLSKSDAGKKHVPYLVLSPETQPMKVLARSPLGALAVHGLTTDARWFLTRFGSLAASGATKGLDKVLVQPWQDPAPLDPTEFPYHITGY